MIKQILIAFAATLLLLFTSCAKDDNLTVEMEGFWQLTEMRSGNEVESRDDIYYGFQKTLIQIQKVYRGFENDAMNYRGRYWCEGDSVYFALFSGGSTVSAEFRLEPYMGEEYVNKFKIETLTNSKMVWTRGDDERFVFRKY